MNTKQLLELADRCEREEPSRVLDVRIAVLALGWRDHNKHDPAVQQARGNMLLLTEDERLNWRYAPEFTSSLDAAVTLVPEGMAWSVSMDVSARGLVNKWGEISEDGRAKTPALALCSAALQARAAEAEQIEASKTRSEGSKSASPAEPGGER